MKEKKRGICEDIVLSKPGARRYKPHPLEKSKKFCEDTNKFTHRKLDASPSCFSSGKCSVYKITSIIEERGDAIHEAYALLVALKYGIITRRIVGYI
jgi:hypothetical protein